MEEGQANLLLTGGSDGFLLLHEDIVKSFALDLVSGPELSEHLQRAPCEC